MATCECTSWASRPAPGSWYRPTPVSSHELSMPRMSMIHSDTIQPLSRARGLDADRTRQGERAVRSCDAPLQAHRGENRPAHRAALARVLREAHCRAQAQACGRSQAPSQAPAQPDAAAEDVLILKDKITEDMKAAMRAKDS